MQRKMTMNKKSYLILLLISCIVLVRCGNRDDSNTHFPKALGGLSLSEIVQDEEAAKIINKMHGKKLGVQNNFVVHYGSRFLKNTLYVSVYESAEKAKTDLMTMAMKMAKGSSVFAPLTYSGMGDTVHFQTEGMGHKHYFYRIDNILIWWQVEPDKAEAAYDDLLKFDFTALKETVKGSH
jgi:hypothetical protein